MILTSVKFDKKQAIKLNNKLTKLIQKHPLYYNDKSIFK